MATRIQIIDIATEIYDELDNPSDSSIGAINFWLLQNIGQLNILINTDYALVDSGDEVTPELGIKEKDIYKTLFNIYYFDKRIRSGLGASGFELVQEVTSDGGTVRRVDKVRLAQTYIQMKKEEQIKLQKLINLYKSNDAEPLQVVGDDTFTSDVYFQGEGVDLGRTH